MSLGQPLLISHRYQLYERLGAGGMGAVYRAVDRLTGQQVALKRVLPSAGSPSDVPTQELEGINLTLSREFRTLASLHHPHIIAVIDYGFDFERQPYFTMDLLEHPLTLTDAGHERSLADKVRLLIETLYALAYLHRRGIVHRDLKPGNVLVDKQGAVKMLDFGISVGKGFVSTHLQDVAAGTIAYMAPEVFKEEAATPATDLFAVGIMAYEMLTGRYPYNNANIALLINSLLNSEPDYAGLEPALAWVLARLLAKIPEDRFSSAETVIAELCEATGQSKPEESTAVRESFLVASQFVGRGPELEQLKEAFSQAASGHGSAWLVGGESGVGKSRLLDELRIRAAVRGALVLRGQGVAEGGLPYQIWRDPVRRLILSTELSDLEAGILKELVPDIAALLDRTVPDAPELDGAARQQQLSLTIADLFKRQTQPVLLLLEDMHWAVGSLDPLRQLAQIIAELPLLIVANFRDDERPELPAELPEMRMMHLGRLSNEAIADLSASMLGDIGRQPAIVELLLRETEGNAFFMAEVVRALADEAGSLSEVGHKPLPRQVFAGQVRRILQHRLERVPSDAIELLKLAAVAGRGLDLRLLQRAAGAEMPQLSDWLTLCANAAVLEIVDGQWRFSHDKIREALLASLTQDEQSVLHRKIGEALETEYPNDKQLALMLSEHWYSAGDAHKAIEYTFTAVEHMLSVSAFREAKRALERGLRVLDGHPNAEQETRLLKLLGEANASLGEYEDAAEYYQQSLRLAQNANNVGLEASIKAGIASLHEQQGNLSEANIYATACFALYDRLNDQEGMAYSLELLGHIAYGQDDYRAARDFYERSRALYQLDDNQWGMTKDLNNLGNVAYQQGDLEAARNYYEQSLAFCYQIGNRRGVSIRLNNLANLTYIKRDAAGARELFEQSLALSFEIGDRQGIADTVTALGDVALLEGDLAEARRNYDRSLALNRGLGRMSDIAITLSNLAWVSAEEGSIVKAHAYCLDGLKASLEVDGEAAVIWTLVGYARLYLLSQPERSAELVGLIEAHENTNLEIREFRLKPLLAELKLLLSEAALARALERGVALNLNDVAIELLNA
jgi:predicted ATPase